MKLSTISALLIIEILLAYATAKIANASDANSVSLEFVRSILNASPKIVQIKLGTPDNGVKRSDDCDYLPSCSVASYQGGKFQVLFYNNRLKWIEIKGNELYGKNGPELIGFLKAPPTWENKFMQSWRNASRKGTATGPLIPIKGIEEIVTFPPSGGNNAGYMLINIETNYDKSFAK